VRARVERLLGWLRGVTWIDHHRRAWARAGGLRFTRWAAGMALFGYLAVFPLLVLTFIVFGFVLSHAPGVRSEVETFLRESLPLLFDPQGGQAPVDIAEVARTTVSAGVVAVVALLYAGLGWVGATLEGVRRMQGALRRPGSFVVLKLQDSAALVAMGTVLLAALVGAVVVKATGSSVLESVGWAGGSAWLLQLSAALISGLLLLLTVAALYAFAWWHRPGRRWGVVLRGSFMTSVTLALMLQLSFLLVGRTLGNPVYGTLALAAALLLFLYFSSAVLLYVACWVAVVEGAPETLEEVAYGARSRGGTVVLPAVSEVQTDGDAAATSPRG
jgi:membrane protein